MHDTAPYLAILGPFIAIVLVIEYEKFQDRIKRKKRELADKEIHIQTAYERNFKQMLGDK